MTDDPKIIIELSNEFILKNNHSLALQLAKYGLTIANNHNDKTSLLEQISICGFYCDDVAFWFDGKDACELIALDQRNNWHTKNQARQNSTYYAAKSTNLMPNTILQQVDYNPSCNFKPLNPSITNLDNELWLIQRTVNYIITPDGSYDMQGDNAIRTKNILINLDANLNIIGAEEIFPPINLPDPLYKDVIGFEDSRLFYWKGDFWSTSTVRELNQAGNCEIVLAKIVRKEDNLLHYDEYQIIHPMFCERTNQKNWMPKVEGDDLYFVYCTEPTIIIDIHGNIVSKQPINIAADSFRGGSQLLNVDEGWLSCIHESHIMVDNRRRYMHRFVLYDNDGKLKKYSEAFYFHTLGIEFAAGIAKNTLTGQIIVSFGLADKESWLAVFDKDEINAILKSVPVLLNDISNIDDITWIQSQTNCTLRTINIVDKATEIADRHNVPHHEDRAKNWDNLIALWQATKNIEYNQPIMDIGATKGSAFLPTLARIGYKTLISINIDEQSPRIEDGIVYQLGDCTASSFQNNYFGFISCLSVIEHGVDIELFLKESARILSPNGYLFVSTDYWQDPVDTYNQTAFGSPVKVFTKQDIIDMIQIGKKYGLELTSTIDLECDQRVVNWIGMDYTFINLMFQKIK